MAPGACNAPILKSPDVRQVYPGRLGDDICCAVIDWVDSRAFVYRPNMPSMVTSDHIYRSSPSREPHKAEAAASLTALPVRAFVPVMSSSHGKPPIFSLKSSEEACAQVSLDQHTGQDVRVEKCECSLLFGCPQPRTIMSVYELCN